MGEERDSCVETGKNDVNPNESEKDVVEEAMCQLGHFRLYQRYILVLFCIPNILSAMYSLNYVFVANPVNFRCVIPECEGSAPEYNNSLALLLQTEGGCQRFAPLSSKVSSCAREDYHPSETVQCEQLIYETMETVYSEFSLGCNEWRRTFVGSVRNMALPFALILTGYISDGWGRLTAFCIFSACEGVLGIVKAFSINYQMYVAMEFFEAMLGYGFNSAGYVLLMELARPSLRSTYAAATGVSYGLGGVFLAYIARGVGYWRWLLVVAHAPALILPVYWYLADESPRWLHSRGRGGDAAKVIKKAASLNKTTVTEDALDAVRALAGPSHKDGQGLRARLLQLREMVATRKLFLRFAACCWYWIASSFVYYGLTINSVSLASDEYTNFALSMVMEIAASLMVPLMMERCGRRWTMLVSFIICGVTCVVPFFIEHSGATMTLLLIGKLFITLSYNSVYVYTSELFPTRARSSALAACSLVGRVGSITAPYTPLLTMYVQVLLYGGVSLTAALAVLAIPETRHAALPADVTAAERLADTRPINPFPPPQPPATRILSANS